MSPKLSAPLMFWTGALLAIVGEVGQQYLSFGIFSLWGNDALQAFANGPLSLVFDAPPLFVALGAILVACSLIARNIESAVDSQPRTRRWRPMPPRLTARQIAWTGVILVVVGLILTNTVGGLFMGLDGKVDFASNLVRDILSIVVQPLGWVILPVGIALLPCSLVVRMLESRTRDREVEEPLILD